MRVGIIGLGLIGGSLGIDLVARGHEVIGIARRPQIREQALAGQVVHQAGDDYSLLRAVDLVFICTPIETIGTMVGAIAPHLPPHAVVTDVGSVKAPVVAVARSHWQRFVGGHPMAGKAEAGLGAAEANLFRNRPYVLTPDPDTPTDAVNAVKIIAAELGARLHCCDPNIHDRAVAWISHLPVIVSSSLIQACLQEPDSELLSLAQTLASSGFEDTSRVGGGSPELGLMMARHNRQALLHTLEVYQQVLDQLKQAVQTSNWEALERHLQQSQAARHSFLEPG